MLPTAERRKKKGHRIGKGRINVLDYFNGVEDDVRAILENGEFPTRVHSKECRVQVLACDRIYMVRGIIDAFLLYSESNLLAIQRVRVMI